VIEDGVKLDNLIQIGHNVRVGRHTAMAGLRGCGGQRDHRCALHVGGGAIVLGHLNWPTTSTSRRPRWSPGRSCKPGHYTGMFPIDDNARWEKNAATLKQLHSLRERIKALEKRQSKTCHDGHPPDSQATAAPLPVPAGGPVLELEKGKRIKALKNVTINEPFSWAISRTAR
jgi:hypothetical protein